MPLRRPRPDSASENGSLAEIARRAEAIVRKEGPGLRVERRWGHPWFVGRDLVLVIGAFTHHVGVEFWRGSTVLDPHHLLEGSGKNLRHVRLRSLAEANAPEFADLVRAAIELDLSEPPRGR